MTTTSVALTADTVEAAYAALGSGDRGVIERYWDREMTWLTAGTSRISGTYAGLDRFLSFVETMGKLTGGSLKAEFAAILVSGDIAVALTRNTAVRADDPTRRLDIEEAHYLRWREGRIIEGRGAMFGTGVNEFDRFVA